MEQQRILEILGLSPKTEKAVLAVLSKKQTAEICEKAYSGEAPDYPILKRKPLTRLAVLINLLSEKYEEYLSLGVPKKLLRKPSATLLCGRKFLKLKPEKPESARKMPFGFAIL